MHSLRHRCAVLTLLSCFSTLTDAMEKSIDIQDNGQEHQRALQNQWYNTVAQQHLVKNLGQYNKTATSSDTFHQNLVKARELCQKGNIPLAQAIAQIYKGRTEEYASIQRVINETISSKDLGNEPTLQNSVCQTDWLTYRPRKAFNCNGKFNTSILPDKNTLEERLKFFHIVSFADETHFVKKIQELKNKRPLLAISDIDLLIAQEVKQYLRAGLDGEQDISTTQKLLSMKDTWKRALYIALFLDQPDSLKTILQKNGLPHFIEEKDGLIFVPQKDTLQQKLETHGFQDLIQKTTIISDLLDRESEGRLQKVKKLVYIVDKNTDEFFYDNHYRCPEIEQKSESINSPEHRLRWIDQQYETLRRQWKNRIYDIFLEREHSVTRDILRAEINRIEAEIQSIHNAE